MKKILTLLMLAMLLLGVHALAEGLSIADDVKEQVFTVSATDEYNGTATHAEMLRVQYVGADAPETALTDADAAYDYAWEAFGVAGLTIYAPEDEAQLRFVYDGITGEDVGDHEMVDYDSRYDGYLDGQIRRIYYHPTNRYAIYISYYFNPDDSGNAPHLVDRVAYTPETKDWVVTRFDSDVVTDCYEAQLCAVFNLLDYCGGYEVTTESTRLNVRATPGGEKIEKLEPGAQLTVYNYQMLAQDTGDEALDGVAFTLIAKYSEPHEDGLRYREYFGWCASEYLLKDADFLWVLNGQLADGTENFPTEEP